MYNEKIREHYESPRNAGTIADASGKAVVRSAFDSDTVQITLRIENGVIADVKFKCMGCAVAIACASAATEIVMAQPVEVAYEISKSQVADFLGGIPEQKMQCSNLAPEAIRQAIDHYRSALSN
ncbi:MAG: iron-sulfur cluster assembly scaffold protein [Candidatus Acidiferrales bacterium]